MNLEETKYDAFISYRHCDLDQFVAETLHKELEAFRLPKIIQKQLVSKGIEKKKIERVFRDRDELPITNNLADPITNALRNSEFLLVICSPRLSQSMWCKKEIETFISMHGRERVFAVLIEGEPSESFPEELLYEERKTVDENGMEHIERVPIEPLAADVRGKDKAEIRKKIKEEVIRLAAPMFGCSYDDLKQRHRERMMRRIIAGACVVSAVFGSFGIVSTTMALRIQKQSEQIKEQSEEIQAQADQIEVQYQEALKTNARQMAEDAFDSMDEGDMVGAVQTAYQALTTVNGAAMPYTAEAEYALSVALQTYGNGEQIKPQRMLKQDSQVNFCKLSPNRELLAVVDKFGRMNVYNPLTGEVLYSVEMTGYVTYLSDYEICFIGNTEIAYPMEEGFCIYNFETREVKEYVLDNRATGLVSDKEGKYLAVQDYDSLTVYDSVSMNPLYSLNEEECGITLFMKECVFSEQMPGLIACEYDTLEKKTGICLIDTNEQKHRLYEVDLYSVTDIYLEDEEIFFGGFINRDGDDSKVCSMDFDGNLKWTYPVDGTPDNIKVFGKGSEDKVSFTQYGKMTVLNRADGTVRDQLEVGQEITNYAAYVDSDKMTLMTRDGQYIYYLPEEDSAVQFEGKFVVVSDNIKEFDFGNGYYISTEYSNNSVVVYETSMGDGLSLLLEQEEMTSGTKISPDGTYVAVSVSDVDFRQVIVYDVKNNNKTFEIQTEDFINDFAFNPEGELVVLLKHGVEVYNPADGTEVVKRTTETENIRLVKNSTAYVAGDIGVTSITDVKTGDVLASVAEERIVENGLFASCVDEDGLYYAYADEENKKVVIGSFEDEGIMELPLKVNTIQFLAIAPGAKTLYVTYLDDSVEAYDFMTGNLVMNYGILDNGVENVTELENIGKTILYSPSKAFLVNDAKEVIAFIQGYSDYHEMNDSFILDDSYRVYEAKRHETQELLQKAEELIKE